MRLYEINAEIEKCIMPNIDAETGELIEELIDWERLAFLQMEKDEKIKNLGQWVKNLRAEAEALKVEKMRLADRQKKTENKIESLTRYIEESLNGDTFKSDDCTVDIRYRRSKKVEIVGRLTESEVIQSLMQDGREDLLTQKAPTLNKTAIKNAILKDGEAFEGLDVIETRNIQIN